MATTIDDVRSAAAALAGSIVRTPMPHSRLLSELCGDAQVFLKMENLQYTASFKERGALVKLLSLAAEQRRRGVIAMSAGNHALGVAYHAQRLGIPATIVMPKATPFVKIAHTRHFGARVVLHGNSLAEAAVRAHQLAQADDLAFVHPYDDPLIIAGQGTVALEMLEERPDLDALVIPVGGGGLIAGCAVAARALRSDIRIVGVESELYSSMAQAVHQAPSGKGGVTIAEGIAVAVPGRLASTIIAETVDELVTVSDTQIERAIQLLVEIEKTVTEGAGAAALAYVFAHAERFAGQRVGIVLCGGNIDSRLLASVLMRGLVCDGRLVRMRLRLSDAPGELAKLANLIGEAQANIVELSHQRWFHNVPIKMAEVDVVVETRDLAHVQELVERLNRAGFAPSLLSDRPAAPSAMPSV